MVTNREPGGLKFNDVRLPDLTQRHGSITCYCERAAGCDLSVVAAVGEVHSRTSQQLLEDPMSIIRVGTTKKYAEGWDAIFGGKRKSAAKKSVTSGKKRARKTAGRKK
jgi:hypothetical protein